MTDRINALVVVLDHDIRDDDAQPLIAAIHQLRGVLSVTRHMARPVEDMVARIRAREDLERKVMELVEQLRGPD